MRLIDLACQLSAEHLHPTKKRMSVSIPDIEQLHCAVHVYCRSMLLTFQVMPSLANSFDNLHSRSTQKTQLQRCHSGTHRRPCNRVGPLVWLARMRMPRAEQNDESMLALWLALPRPSIPDGHVCVMLPAAELLSRLLKQWRASQLQIEKIILRLLSHTRRHEGSSQSRRVDLLPSRASPPADSGPSNPLQ